MDPGVATEPESAGPEPELTRRHLLRVLAALAWTTIVPLLLMVEALAITAALTQRREARA
jgi:hypothetical protein